MGVNDITDTSELAKRIAIENVALTVASHYSGYARDHAKMLADAERVIQEQITAPLESELNAARVMVQEWMQLWLSNPVPMAQARAFLERTKWIDR